MSLFAAPLGAAFAAGGTGARCFRVCRLLLLGRTSQERSISSVTLPPQVSSSQMSSSSTGSIFFLDLEEAPGAAGFRLSYCSLFVFPLLVGRGAGPLPFFSRVRGCSLWKSR